MASYPRTSANDPYKIATPDPGQMSVSPQGMYQQPMPPQGMNQQPMPSQGMNQQPMPPQGMYQQPMPPQGMYQQPMPPQGMYQQPQQMSGYQYPQSQPQSMMAFQPTSAFGPDWSSNGITRPPPRPSKKLWCCICLLIACFSFIFVLFFLIFYAIKYEL